MEPAIQLEPATIGTAALGPGSSPPPRTNQSEDIDISIQPPSRKETETEKPDCNEEQAAMDQS